MSAAVFVRKSSPKIPKFYVELFDSESVFLASAQLIGKRVLRFIVDSKVSYKKGDGIHGRLYGLRSKLFLPFVGIVRERRELQSKFYTKLCELVLESEEDFE
ncbi:hypothetical protein EHQ53_08795 [Leptospira langatensis]|uniref:Uncharacterized protein n=1 Tax=Leptospira langatensis TaxID=2484983 RepID=A0A5F1ZUY7_9LEPT|nr:hypothetical protein [Leptospira langatensis]TGK01274.1 hypothetical protein EHO57_10075 [Leptospira langatensis]TGL42273.1 hypothetical protein EHQ53_08795 [Leptospira langatensis]